MYDNNRKTVNYDTTFFCRIVNEYISIHSYVKNNKDYHLASVVLKKHNWYMVLVVVFQVLMTKACKAKDTEIAD